MRFALATGLAGLLLLIANQGTPAQPTYKLDVKPNLKPLAALKLEGTKITRTNVKDDPGFRLQYHFKKDGKTLAAVEARTDLSLMPQKEAGRTRSLSVLNYWAARRKGIQGGEQR